MPARALTQESLGAWLLKASPGEHSVDDLVRQGFATDSSWCVRPTYRADLVRRGQPVLLWVSGHDPRAPAGIHAQGLTTGPADTATGRLAMPVVLRAVVPPVLRADLVRHPRLSGIEVLRMAAGSNPSYLLAAQLDELRAEWPQVTVGADR